MYTYQLTILHTYGLFYTQYYFILYALVYDLLRISLLF